MPGFELGDDNAEAVARICRAFDGLPLAIELAAARIRVLGPDGMAQRIGERLALLTRRAPDLAERQRSLRATIEWSVRLLDEPARAAFRGARRLRGACVARVDRARRRRRGRRRTGGDGGAPRRVARHFGGRFRRASHAFGCSRRFATTRSPTSERAGPKARRATGTSPTSSTRSVAGTPHDAATRTTAATSRSSTRSIPTSWRRSATQRRRAPSSPSSSFSAMIWRYWRWRGYVEDAHHHLDVGNRVGRPASPAAGGRKRVARRVGDRVDPRRPASRGLARRASCGVVRRGRRAAARGEGPGPARVDRERQRRSRTLAHALRASCAGATRRR